MRGAYDRIEGRRVVAVGARAAPRERAAPGRRAAELLRISSAFRNTLRRRGRSNVGLPPSGGGRTDVRRQRPRRWPLARTPRPKARIGEAAAPPTAHEVDDQRRPGHRDDDPAGIAPARDREHHQAADERTGDADEDRHADAHRVGSRERQAREGADDEPREGEDDQVDEQAHAWTVARRAPEAAQGLRASWAGHHSGLPPRRGAPMRTLGLHRRPGLAVALATAAVALAPPAASAADVSDLLPAVSPPGANDFTCKPTAAHPAPVVLVHGTFEGAADNWATASPKFKAAGYCVFALDYGNRATGDIAASGGQLERFVDAVLAVTGARKVSMVGHSQGGMMPRYYLKFLGGLDKVDDLVGLVPSNHGTQDTGPGNPLTQAAFGVVCPACVQQTAGSPFLTNLNAGDETPGHVSYTQITTRYDEVVTPYLSAYLAPGKKTTNITLQDLCPADRSDHVFIPTDPVAIQLVLDALGRPGPADPAFRPTC